MKLTDGTTTANFLTGNARLAVNGYSMLEDYDEEGYVWETIKLINPSSATTSGDIRTAKKTIDDLLESARRYHFGQLEPSPVWVYCQSEGESARRAVVIDGKSEIVGTEFDSPLLGDFGLELNLAIRRGKWETETTTVFSRSSLGDNGEKWSIGQAYGTLPQRIGYLSIAGANNNNIGKAWIGIRPIYQGVAGFIPLWEAEDARIGANDVSVKNGAGVSGGQYLEIDFTENTTLDNVRFSIYLEDIATGNYNHLVGRYLVLARMGVSSSVVQCGVELRAGQGQGTETIIGMVYVDSDYATADNWQIYEIGEIQMPIAGNRGNAGVTDDRMKDFNFSLYAERLSEAGKLNIDYFLLVPAEHMVTVNTVTNNPDLVEVYSEPDGYEHGAGYLSSGPTYFSVEPPSFHNWSYPVDGGVMVIAVTELLTASRNIHNLNNYFDLELILYPKWTSYRTA